MKGPPSTSWPACACTAHTSVKMYSSSSETYSARPINSTVIYNQEILMNVLEKRVDERKKCGVNQKPVITICNHISCMDDPLVWGALLKFKHVLYGQLRWVPTAAEICFTNRPMVYLFSRGQCVPVVRGMGVYQQGVNFCLDRLNENEWVHFFPEGKVNIANEKRLKWGVGRVISELSSPPDVIPFWMIGMDDILPSKTPYIPRVGKRAAIYVGEPIQVSSEVAKVKQLTNNPMVIRKHITDYIQEEFWILKEEAISHHQSQQR